MPAGHLWVMGDHREVSYDSRGHIGDPGGGTIPESRVIGRAFVVVWPLSRVKTLSIPPTFGAAGLALPNDTLPGGTVRSRLRRRAPGDAAPPSHPRPPLSLTEPGR